MIIVETSYIELKNPGKEEKRLSDLQKKCREMENSMSTTSIHHMRALALKWMDSISELASCFAMDDQECKNSASFIEVVLPTGLRIEINNYHGLVCR